MGATRLAVALAAGILSWGSDLRASQTSHLIWPRIAHGLRITEAEHPPTVKWARHYARTPKQYTRMLARAEPFLWYIVESVELSDMPLEIALLPAVESGFDPHAHSPQKAKGLWQFVPWTGRALGLQVRPNYDGLRDPVASTRAALTYLLQLHDRFGNWPLALAAYNMGDARLSAEIRRQGTREFWELKLPPETRDHVPRLLGLALTIKQPQRFGVKLPPIRNRPTFEMVELETARDITSAARSAGVAMDTVERYNPGLLDPGNSSGKKVLMLPPGDAVRMRAELGRREYRPARDSRHIEHVVVPGDSLWTIARRYKVSVQQLAVWNGLNPKSTLRAGRKLMVIAAS